MKDKIIKHGLNNYSSSPYKFDDEQVELIIKHNCNCDYCGESIFDMYDFPEVLTGKDELLCENCYDEYYRDVCPVCEESYEKEEFSEYFFITKETSKIAHKPVGMYRILAYPFFYGDCLSGFDAFFNDSIEKVSSIDINEAYSILHPRNNKDILMDCICSECAEKYTRKDFFIKTDSLFIILIKSQRHDFFAHYSDERIHQVRQDLIHRRITFREMLQKHNSHVKDSNL